jgi:hypothetical protein
VGYGRAFCKVWSRQRPSLVSPNNGCIRRHRCGILGLRRCWLFSRACPGSTLFCGVAVDPAVGPLTT